MQVTDDPVPRGHWRRLRPSRSARPACGGGSIDEQTKAECVELRGLVLRGRQGHLRRRSTWRSTRGCPTRRARMSSARWPSPSSAVTVIYKELKEDVSWQGFGTGEVDVVIEDWGHPDLEKKFMKDKGGDGSAIDGGPNGNKGIIHWYVPPWLADRAPRHPGLPEPQQVRRRSSRPRESGGQGQFLGSDPSYVQFKVVVIGAGIVGNCLVGHLSQARVDRHRPARQGPAAQPRWQHRPRQQLHLPTDHNKEMAFLTVDSQNQYIDAGLNNTCGGIEVARTEERMEEFKPADDLGQGVGHRGQPGHPGGGQGDGAVPRRGRPPRRLLHPQRQRRRLARRPAP
jgi:hypothetical protein